MVKDDPGHNGLVDADSIAKRRLQGQPLPELTQAQRERLIETASAKRHIAERRLQELEDAAQSMRELWGNVGANKINEDMSNPAESVYLHDRQIFDKAVGLAIRAGLLDHPVVRNWIADHRSFGQWDELRRYKKSRLERGVKRSMSKNDLWLICHAPSLISEEKYSVEQTRQSLVRILDEERNGNRRPDRAKEPLIWFGFSDPEVDNLRAQLKNMAEQNFRRWLKRLGIIPKLSPPEN